MSSSDLYAGIAGVLWLISGTSGGLASILALYAWDVARQENQAKDEKARASEIELNKTKIQLAQTERKLGPRYLTPNEETLLEAVS